MVRYRETGGLGEWPEGVADAGDIVHIDVVEFRQLDEALDRDAHFALFVVGISGLGNRIARATCVWLRS